MKTTVEIPDELFRRAKATAALRGRKLKDLVEDGLRRVIDEPATAPSAGRAPSMHTLMKEYCGVIDSGVEDLASTPDHLRGFGLAADGDR